jgi:hypothetical protein
VPTCTAASISHRTPEVKQQTPKPSDEHSRAIGPVIAHTCGRLEKAFRDEDRERRLRRWTWFNIKIRVERGMSRPHAGVRLDLLLDKQGRADGTYTLQSVAYDLAGNSGRSANVAIA